MSSHPKVRASNDYPVTVNSGGFDQAGLNGVYPGDTITFTNNTGGQVTIDFDPGLTDAGTSLTMAGTDRPKLVNVIAANDGSTYAVTDESALKIENTPIPLKVTMAGKFDKADKPGKRGK
jgi:hypothetical protein